VRRVLLAPAGVQIPSSFLPWQESHILYGDWADVGLPMGQRCLQPGLAHRFSSHWFFWRYLTCRDWRQPIGSSNPRLVVPNDKTVRRTKRGGVDSLPISAACPRLDLSQLPLADRRAAAERQDWPRRIELGWGEVRR